MKSLDYPEAADDAHRIQRILYTRGYNRSIDDCIDVWCGYSEQYAANWISLPEGDDELWALLSNIINK